MTACFRRQMSAPVAIDPVVSVLRNHAKFSRLLALRPAICIASAKRVRVRPWLLQRRIDGRSGGQDKRDGAKCRPRLCLHILFDGAMPSRDGAISAPSPCAASILIAPDCRTRAECLCCVEKASRPGDRIDDGA